MIYYEVKNKNDILVASSLENCPSQIYGALKYRATENVQVNGARNVYREDSRGSVRLVIIDDSELTNSNRGISRVAEVYLSLIPEFDKIRRGQRQHFDTILKRFTHNLSDIQKRLKGQLQRIVPDGFRERNYDATITIATARIQGDIAQAAADFVEIAQRATDFDAQIAGLRVISGLSDEVRPSYIRANIMHELYRYEQPFDKDFQEKGIQFDVQIDSGEASRKKVQVDPALLNVAFSQFHNNALKYVRPGTKITVTVQFDGKKCFLKINMTSTFIETYEVEKIFKEKYTGRHATYASGDGIGMFLLHRALSAMGASIKVIPGSTGTLVGDKKYAENTFVFEFIQVT